MHPLGYIIRVDSPDNECGHNTEYCESFEEAERVMKEMKREFESGDYYNSAEVSLCAVLKEEEWECKGKYS
jgi:hypothetical protein